MAEKFVAGETALIHFLHKSDSGNVFSPGIQEGILGKPAPGGQYAVACNPASKLPTHATGVASAANCPLCMETDAYKAAMAESTTKKMGESEADMAVARMLASK
jgi:hypothetical protein